MACRVTYIDGRAVVKDNNGLESRLYRDILNQVDDQDTALDMWAMTTTPEYEAATGTKDGNTTVKTVMEYFEEKNLQEQAVLSPSEELQVRDTFSALGFKSLSELHRVLKNVLYPQNGEEFNSALAINSGLFTHTEIKDLDVPGLTKILGKIEKTLAHGDILSTEEVTAPYRDTTRKTILGTGVPVTEQQVLSELVSTVDNMNSKEEIDMKIANLPYTTFINKMAEDTEYADKVYSMLAKKKRVPSGIVLGGRLSTDNVGTIAKLMNTLNTDMPFIDVEARITFLNRIDESVWQDNQKEIRIALEKLERQCAESGFDIVGLAQRSEDQTAVLSFLNTTENLLRKVESRDVSMQDIVDFAGVYDIFMGVSPESRVIDIPSDYEGYSLLHVEVNLSDKELADSHGLIKVGENLYHKIDPAMDKNDIYEYLYGEFLDGNLELPASILSKKEQKDILNKKEVLAEITSFIVNRKTGVEGTNQELISLVQVAFKHQPFSTKESAVKKQSKLGSTTKDNFEYLKTDFISDIFKKILIEKAENSYLYQNKLSKFIFNDKGISLIENIDNLDGVPLREDLENYIRIKKDTAMDYLVTNQELAPTRVLYPNITQSLTEYQGTASIDSGYVITKPNTEDYLKLGEQVYKKKMSTEYANLYAPIFDEQDNVYYNTEPKVVFDEVRAGRILKNYDKISGKTAQDFRSVFENSGVFSPMAELLKTPVKENKKDIVAGFSSILDSQVEVVSLSESPQEDKNVYEKIAECE